MSNIFYPTLTKEQIKLAAKNGKVFKSQYSDIPKITSLKDYIKQESQKVRITNCLKDMTLQQIQHTEFQPIIDHAQVFKGEVIYWLKDYGCTSWTIELPLEKAEKLDLPIK